MGTSKSEPMVLCQKLVCSSDSGWFVKSTSAIGHEHWAVTKDLEQTWLKLGALFYKNKGLSEELLSLLLNGVS